MTKVKGTKPGAFRKALGALKSIAVAATLAVAVAVNPLERYAQNPAGKISEGGGGMSPGQRRFHQDTSKNRLLRCANKVGKTFALSAEAWWFLTGTHPFRDDVVMPCRVLYVVEDFGKSYADDVCSRLRELEPPGVLHSDTTYDTLRGYRVSGRPALKLKPVVRCDGCDWFVVVEEDVLGQGCPHCSTWHSVRPGSTMVFRSGQQDGAAFAGLSADAVLVNEPPREHKWGETVRAAAEKNAPIAVAFTAVDNHGASRDLTWLRTIIEGDEGKGIDPSWLLDNEGLPQLDEDGNAIPLWSQTVIKLTPENVPHRDPSDVHAQVANCPPAEYEIRIEGGWDTLAQDRMLISFGRQCVFSGKDLPNYNGEPLSVGLCADHGERPGAEFWLLYAYIGKGPTARVWILDEYASPSRTTEAQDVQGILQMLDRWDLTIYDVDRVHGDTNSAGKTRMGSINQVFEEEFAEAVTGNRTARVVTIRGAEKGAGSVAFGTRVLNSAIASARLWVHENCRLWRRAARRWAGKDDGYKHAIDTSRYGVVPILEPRSARGAMLGTT